MKLSHYALSKTTFHTRSFFLYITLLTISILLCFASITYAERPSLTLGAAEMCNSQQFEIVQKVYSAIFDRAGYDVKIKTLPLTRMRKMIQEGQIDGDFLSIEEDEKLKGLTIRVNTPVFAVDYAIYTRKDSYPELASTEAIANYKSKILNIGYIRGSLSAEKVIQRIAHAHHEYPLNQHAQCFDMLRLGRIDIVIGPERALECLKQQQQPRYDEITIRGIASSLPGYIFLTQKHETLVPVLESIISSMQDDGSIWSIVEKHLSETPTQSAGPDITQPKQ
ncbi:substrate-binding periplasmic protein [Oleidesulfovibrio sp.]|uniref:substrate-binding periplasmic protein n=1 Tax=Oleidesulfovibrio sp. TaxID=2909707 RepID=UPI003A83B3B8